MNMIVCIKLLRIGRLYITQYYISESEFIRTPCDGSSTRFGGRTKSAQNRADFILGKGGINRKKLRVFKTSISVMDICNFFSTLQLLHTETGVQKDASPIFLQWKN